MKRRIEKSESKLGFIDECFRLNVAECNLALERMQGEFSGEGIRIIVYPRQCTKGALKTLQMANNIDYKRSKTDIPSSSPSESNDNTALGTNKISKHKRIKKLLLHRSKSEQLSDDISTLPSPTTTSFTTTSNQHRNCINKSVLDDGKPSLSTYNDLQRVLKLIQDERHLVAYELYVDAKRRIIDRKTRASTDKQQKKNEKKL